MCLDGDWLGFWTLGFKSTDCGSWPGWWACAIVPLIIWLLGLVIAVVFDGVHAIIWLLSWVVWLLELIVMAIIALFAYIGCWATSCG
jgi:hypothetical protein